MINGNAPDGERVPNKGGEVVAAQKTRQEVMDGQMIEEQVKQIALNHFYSYYVRHDMEEMMRHVGESVQWIGSKDCYIAHNRIEFRTLLEKELEKVPLECMMKVISINAMPIAPDCYNVSGELELRLPFEMNIYYATLRFSMMIRLIDEQFVIISIHTSTTGKSVLIEKPEIFNQNADKKSSDLNVNQEYDMVTGLLHLDEFKKRADVLFKKSNEVISLALVCTDISNFEMVNNLYGLHKADQLLADAATLLTTFSKDVLLCCRSVADHFLALIAYKEQEELIQLLEQVCDEFGNRISTNYSEAFPQLGIGVYLVTDRQESIEKMVEYANVARKSLSVQKKTRIVIYDAQVYNHMKKVGKIERSMQSALENQEFKAFLQPKYDLETGQIVGAEALVRWIHPDGSMVYPDEFIPVFEKNGFIVRLDFFVLSEICQMIQERIKKKKSCVPISINQSRVLLQEKDYVGKVAGILAYYNTPPQLIELELTERIFRDDLTGLAVMMGQLRDLGIRWSIDDFGTGYSSLNLLKELPVDIIKIDKSFLDETESSETSKIIIRKTVELTQELDKTVICEGVETENQADYLRGIRCDMAQGYLYAKPMPMQDFENLLDKEMYG